MIAKNRLNKTKQNGIEIKKKTEQNSHFTMDDVCEFCMVLYNVTVQYGRCLRSNNNCLKWKNSSKLTKSGLGFLFHLPFTLFAPHRIEKQSDLMFSQLFVYLFVFQHFIHYVFFPPVSHTLSPSLPRIYFMVWKNAEIHYMYYIVIPFNGKLFQLFF